MIIDVEILLFVLCLVFVCASLNSKNKILLNELYVSVYCENIILIFTICLVLKLIYIFFFMNGF